MLEGKNVERRMTKEEAKDFLCSIARDLRLIYGEDYTSKDGTTMCDAIEILEKEPKKCHNENNDYDDCDQFICSNCGIELQDFHSVERDEDGDISFHEYVFRYCPNCGAKVEVEE